MMHLGCGGWVGDRWNFHRSLGSLPASPFGLRRDKPLAPNDKTRPTTRQPGRLPHKSGRLMKLPFVEQASRLLGGRAVHVNPCVGAASRRGGARDDIADALPAACYALRRDKSGITNVIPSERSESRDLGGWEFKTQNSKLKPESDQGPNR
jgi:hypothetical protein